MSTAAAAGQKRSHRSRTRHHIGRRRVYRQRNPPPQRCGTEERGNGRHQSASGLAWRGCGMDLLTQLQGVEPLGPGIGFEDRHSEALGRGEEPGGRDEQALQRHRKMAGQLCRKVLDVFEQRVGTRSWVVIVHIGHQRGHACGHVGQESPHGVAQAKRVGGRVGAASAARARPGSQAASRGVRAVRSSCWPRHICPALWPPRHADRQRCRLAVPVRWRPRSCRLQGRIQAWPAAALGRQCPPAPPHRSGAPGEGRGAARRCRQ